MKQTATLTNTYTYRLRGVPVRPIRGMGRLVHYGGLKELLLLCCWRVSVVPTSNFCIVGSPHWSALLEILSAWQFYHIDHLAILEIIKYQRRQSKWFVTFDFSTVYVFNIDSSLHLRLEQLSGRLWVWLFHWDFKLKHKNFVTRSPSLSKRSQTGPLKYIDNKNHGRSPSTIPQASFTTNFWRGIIWSFAGLVGVVQAYFIQLAHFFVELIRRFGKPNFVLSVSPQIFVFGIHHNAVGIKTGYAKQMFIPLVLAFPSITHFFHRYMDG